MAAHIVNLARRTLIGFPRGVACRDISMDMSIVTFAMFHSRPGWSLTAPPIFQLDMPVLLPQVLCRAVARCFGGFTVTFVSLTY